MNFSFNGRNNNNRPSLLLPTMFLVHLFVIAATDVHYHLLVEYFLLVATFLVLIHVTLPLSLTLFQYSDPCGHTAKTCYKLYGYPPNHSRRQENTVNKDPDFEPSWLLDSSTSHHVTGDLANLTLPHDYTENDKLVVANGNGLTITHSGSTSLPTSSSPLHLNNILSIFDISQNLLFVSQLCQSNFVCSEFFHTLSG